MRSFLQNHEHFPTPIQQLQLEQQGQIGFGNHKVAGSSGELRQAGSPFMAKNLQQQESNFAEELNFAVPLPAAPWKSDAMTNYFAKVGASQEGMMLRPSQRQSFSDSRLFQNAFQQGAGSQLQVLSSGTIRAPIGVLPSLPPEALHEHNHTGHQESSQDSDQLQQLFASFSQVSHNNYVDPTVNTSNRLSSGYGNLRKVPLLSDEYRSARQLHQTSAGGQVVGGSTIVPCRARGMPRDHNVQVRRLLTY